jgi:hypothetical protein
MRKGRKRSVELCENKEKTSFGAARRKNYMLSMQSKGSLINWLPTWSTDESFFDGQSIPILYKRQFAQKFSEILQKNR